MKQELNDLNFFLKQSSRKSNKIRGDKGSKLCKKLMKLWLEINDIETYSTQGRRITSFRIIC